MPSTLDMVMVIMVMIMRRVGKHMLQIPDARLPREKNSVEVWGWFPMTSWASRVSLLNDLRSFGFLVALRAVIQSVRELVA